MKKQVIILILIFCLTEVLALALVFRSLFFPLKYTDLIIKYSQENSLSSELVASVINAESSFKADAKSSAGAIGLMQILPSTASYISSLENLNYNNADDLFNPEKNINIGCKYLKYLIDKFENINTALASYNAGETTVINWLKNPEYSSDNITLNKIPYKETEQYVKKINKNIKIYKKIIK